MIKKEKNRLSNTYPNLYKVLTNTSNKLKLNSIIKSLTYKEYTYNEHVMESFLDVEWDKDFYSLLIDKEKGLAKKRIVFKDRSACKKLMMYILYDKLSSNNYSKEVFGNLFPLESELIKILNSLDGENYLPILLQRLESSILLEQVCKKISEELPNAPILPVHDSVYTTEEFAEPVRKIMEKTLTEVTSIKPGIKLEISSKANVLKELLSTVHGDYEDLIRKNITSKRRKKEPIPYEGKIGVKDSILKDFPEHNGKKIISTRYIKPDLTEGDYLTE